MTAKFGETSKHTFTKSETNPGAKESLDLKNVSKKGETQKRICWAPCRRPIPRMETPQSPNGFAAACTDFPSPARIRRRLDEFVAPAQICHHGFAPAGQRVNLWGTRD
jgi:hypothetical protein